MKKNFEKIVCFLKTKSELYLLLFLILGISFPSFAQAGVWSKIWNAITGIPFLFPAVVAAIFTGVTSLFAQLSVVFLSWITSVDISYTKNEVVLAGLAITQSLANMFLVLILVFIGIATMLRLAGYETKKLLRDFIIIALLVNFAPVIAGVAIDAANIIMNYFLSGATGDNYIYGKLSADGKQLLSGFEQIFTGSSLGDKIEPIAKFVMLGILNIVLFFVLLAFALVFLGRMMILWILVILAPLAFVFRILPLPLTRKYYDQWLQSFINWTTLGIFLSFFLYLANVATQVRFTAPTGLWGGTIVLIVPIVFYIIALQMGLSVGGIGSKMVGAGKGYGKKLGITGWQKTKSLVRQVVPERIKNFGQRIATMGGNATWGQGQTGPKAWLKRTGAGAVNAATYLPRYAVRSAGGIIGPNIDEQQKNDIKKAQEATKGKNAASQESAFRSAVTDAEKVGILNAAIEDKNDIHVNDVEIRRLIGSSRRWDAHKIIERANPHLAAPAGVAVDPYNAAATTNSANVAIRNAVNSMKTTDYARITPQTINRATTEGRVAVAAMIRNMTRDQFQKGFESLGADFTEAIENELDAAVAAGLGPNRREVLRRRNAKLHQFLTSSLGAGLISL